MPVRDSCVLQGNECSLDFIFQIAPEAMKLSLKDNILFNTEQPEVGTGFVIRITNHRLGES